jgi:hypothetical protein
MTRVMFNSVQLATVVCGLALSGCAGFQGWQGPATATEGDSSQGYSPHPTDLSNAEGIRTAVEDAQQFLQEQDGKVRNLLEMRADLEEKIHTIQETEIGRLNGETEALRDRVASVESQALLAREEIDAQWAPVQALAETQASELTNLKESMLAIVEETHQDRQLLRNNLKNYRDALVEFHALMVKLETLVLDEEFRAKEAETAMSKTMKDHGLTLTRLESKSSALGHVQKRMTQLHRYVNEVQKDLRHAVAIWQAETPGRDGLKQTAREEQHAIFSTPPSLPIEDLPTRPSPALVPEVGQVIKPFEAPAARISNEKVSVTGSHEAEGGVTVK